MFQKIKALHQSGLGYRKIAHKLNAENLTTHKGKKWGGVRWKLCGRRIDRTLANIISKLLLP